MTKHGIHATFSALGLLAVLACQQDATPTQSVGAEAEDAEPAQLAARLNDRDITVDELDQYIKDELFERATSNGDPGKLYEVRSQAVARYLEQQIVEEAASATNLSPEEFLSEQIEATGEVTDEEIAAYYEENKDRMGGSELADVSDRIETYLRALRGSTLVAEMREAAGAVVLLEPARIEVEAVGPSKGPDDAAVTIVEFSDFQCPYCQRAVPTIEQILEKYPTQVRIVFRHLPLDTIHDRAKPAAVASHCAGNQEKFWDYHDVLFDNNRALSDEDLERYAADMGLDMEAFKQCVSDPESHQIVDNDAVAAASLGLTGTPAFFVNGIPMTGAQPLEKFSAIIDEELSRPTAESSAPTS